MTLLTFIYFILILGVIVLIHEFGHFIFAKKAGIYVYEFSIGMGPRIFKWTRKNDETEYSIRLIPIGGFVQMAGEEIEDDPEVPKDKKFSVKTFGQKFMTVIAGIMNNFILAIVLFFIIALFTGAPQNKALVGEIDKEYPAYTSGLKTGDRILKLNGKDASTYDTLALQAGDYVAMLPFESSDTRVKHVGLISDQDIRIEIESGLMDLSKQYFDPSSVGYRTHTFLDFDEL